MRSGSTFRDFRPTEGDMEPIASAPSGVYPTKDHAMFYNPSEDGFLSVYDEFADSCLGLDVFGKIQQISDFTVEFVKDVLKDFEDASETRMGLEAFDPVKNNS